MTSPNAEDHNEICETAPDGSRRNRRVAGDGAQDVAATKEYSCSTTSQMEVVVEGSNMRRAYARVVANKGAAGSDNMSVEDLAAYLRAQTLQYGIARMGKVLMRGFTLTGYPVHTYRVGIVQNVFVHVASPHGMPTKKGRSLRRQLQPGI